MKGESQVKVYLAKGNSDDSDHSPAHQHSQYAPDGSSDEGIDSPFEGEHADDMTLLRSHRTGHAQLLFALRGKHDKDEEDEQDTCRNGELPEQEKYGRERTSGFIGIIQCILFHRFCF